METPIHKKRGRPKKKITTVENIKQNETKQEIQQEIISEAKNSTPLSSDNIIMTEVEEKKEEENNVKEIVSIDIPCPIVQQIEASKESMYCTEMLKSIEDKIDDSWKKEFRKRDVFNSNYFKKICAMMRTYDKMNYTIYPQANEVFHVFSMPLEKVKVVIFGQDPYINENEAHGYCFSTKDNTIPPSLKNIYKEISDCIPNYNKEQQKTGNLQNYIDQGVFLLNSILTVTKGLSNSHQRCGWEQFTDVVVEILDDYDEVKKVFMLWGSKAQEKGSVIQKKDVHCILSCSHPSPLGSTKTNSPFVGSKIFQKCNEFLTKNNQDPIHW